MSWRTRMKAKLQKGWAYWVALLSEKEQGTAVALFRITVGLVVAITMVQLLHRHVHEVIWFPFEDGGYRKLGRGPWLVQWLGGPSPEVTLGLLWVATSSGFVLAAGFGGRVTAFVCLQTYIALHRLNGETSGSSDILITNALWLLVLARNTQTLSIDCLLATGKLKSNRLIPAWPRYLAILQMVILYCTTGVQKLSIYWMPFGGWSALYYVLQQPTWGRFDHAWSAWAYPLTQIGTATTWIWEVTAPVIMLILWYRLTPDRPGRLRHWANFWDLRSAWAALGLIFHGIILLLMVVGPFSPIAMAYYWNLYRPSELNGYARRLGLRLGLVKKWALPPAA